MTLPTIAALERAGLEAWPGIEVEWDGAWVRRATNGYTKRANSLQCFDPQDGHGADMRLDRAIAWFAARNLPPVIRTTPLESPALTEALEARQWRSIDASHVYAMTLGSHAPDPQARVLDVLDPEFLAAQQSLQGQDAMQAKKLRALLAAMKVPAAGIVVLRERTPVASGLMAIADGIVVAGNVITDPAYRRQGMAGAMIQTGLAWALDNGARVAALNVQADNEGAKALYAGLGYRHQYSYLYRVPGEAP
ncbi:MAG: hypothetical protein ABS75_09720 [Pelagibacterium sp. SCN 63-23]|nr:MAG: hypothetical protein ABS75_09720 [Pelagibacterium sp. SCN 63-23]